VGWRSPLSDYSRSVASSLLAFVLVELFAQVLNIEPIGRAINRGPHQPRRAMEPLVGPGGERSNDHRHVSWIHSQKAMACRPRFA
jgi:hypothetical protein